MSFLITDTKVQYFNAKSIELKDVIPPGTYKLDFEKNSGVYLSEYTYEIAHDKVYGDSEKIANHIIDSYVNHTKNKNLGVLFSGKKGLGKSLTIKLIVEKLKETHPIIFINNFFGDEQNSFLLQVKNAVIILDEFDKIYRGSANEESTDDTISKQETLLTILDGVYKNTNNLYLLSCNNVYSLNENLISRPSRIKYHYRFDSIGKESIKDYCKDNLIRKELTNDLVDSLLCNRFVSFDIIQAIVHELNSFNTLSVEDVMKYINIDIGVIDLTYKIAFEYDGKYNVSEYNKTGERINSVFSHWFTNICKTENDDLDILLKFDLRNVKIPLFGFVDITKNTGLFSESNSKFKLLKVEIKETGSPMEKF